MSHTFTDPDLIELDRIWPLGQQLVVPENGTIIVAGAYEGRYMDYLNEMFPTATIHGFEPQPEAFRSALGRLRGRGIMDLSSHGLATANRSVRIGELGTDGASILAMTGETRTVQMRDVVEILHGIEKQIDLFVMNLEGSEWALIPYLLDEMMHHRIASMAIQWHPKYVSSERASRVTEYLGEYYALDYKDSDWTHWTRI